MSSAVYQLKEVPRPTLTARALHQCKDHTVQFYETEAFLSKAVSHFISSGLNQGEAVIIIATQAHQVSFKSELALVGNEFEGALKSGRLVFLDAEEILARLMVAGLPVWDKFYAIVGALLIRGHYEGFFNGSRIRRNGRAIASSRQH